MRGLELGIDKSRPVDISSSINLYRARLPRKLNWSDISTGVDEHMELEKPYSICLYWAQILEDSHFSRAKSRMLSSSISITTTRFHNPIRISLVFWATELDTSLLSSICQPSLICRYRAQGLSLLPGDKVKMVIELDDLSSSVTYRARWLTELGFSSEEKKRKNGN